MEIYDDTDPSTGSAGGDAFAAYFAEGRGADTDRAPVFNPELGLAAESLAPGFTLESLWNAL